MRLRPSLVCALAALAAGCASGDRSVQERGWLGGRYADVVRSSPHESTLETGARVVGMPESVEQDGGALVVGAWSGTPARAAGLEPGDLVLAVDGTPVESAEDLRDAFATKAPGSTAALTFWRDDATHTAQVVVGTERWRREGTVHLGIVLSSRVDLWPFDDGIDLLGLVVVRSVDRVPELTGPEAAYLRAAVPGEEVSATGSEFDLHLLIVGGGVRERIVSQP